MRRLAGALLLLAAAAGAAPVPGSLPAPTPTPAPVLSPGAVLDQLENALNAGNVDAFVAWFAPDGQIRELPDRVYTGTDQLRTYARALAALNYRTERGSVVLEGSKLTWTARVRYDGLRLVGVEQVDATAAAVIEKGKVKVYQPAFSPGSLAVAATTSADGTANFVRSFVSEVFNAGTADRTEEFLAPDFVDRNPFPGRAPTLQGFKDGLLEFRTALPDLRVDVEDVFAAGDRAVVRSTWTGTSKGSYQGAPATYHTVRVGAIEVLRLRDGKIVESWRALDSGELAKQLGLLTPGGQAGRNAAIAPARSSGSGTGTKRGRTGGILGWLNDL